MHIVEMDDGMFCLVSSSQLFVEPRELSKIGGQNRAAIRISCTRKAKPDAEAVITKAAQFLRGTTANARRTYNVSEKAMILAVELACELVATPPDISTADDAEFAEIVSQAVSKAAKDRHTKHPKSFGLAPEAQSEGAVAGQLHGVDHVFQSDAIGIARCLKVSRAGDTVKLLGKAKISASQRTLFEWHGIKVDVAK